MERDLRKGFCRPFETICKTKHGFISINANQKQACIMVERLLNKIIRWRRYIKRLNVSQLLSQKIGYFGVKAVSEFEFPRFTRGEMDVLDVWVFLMIGGLCHGASMDIKSVLRLNSGNRRISG